MFSIVSHISSSESLLLLCYIRFRQWKCFSILIGTTVEENAKVQWVKTRRLWFYWKKETATTKIFPWNVVSVFLYKSYNLMQEENRKTAISSSTHFSIAQSLALSHQGFRKKYVYHENYWAPKAHFNIQIYLSWLLSNNFITYSKAL